MQLLLSLHIPHCTKFYTPCSNYPKHQYNTSHAMHEPKKFQGSRVVKIKIYIYICLVGVAARNSLDWNQCYGGACCLHIQCNSEQCWAEGKWHLESTGTRSWLTVALLFQTERGFGKTRDMSTALALEHALNLVMITTTRMRHWDMWGMYHTCEKWKRHMKFWMKILKGNYHLSEPCVDGRIILKWIIKK